MEQYFEQISKDLNIPLEKIQEWNKHKSVQKIESGFNYIRLKKDIGNIEDGTVVFILENGLEYVRGFPKIPRAHLIESAFKHKFTEAYVEEKMDGYNVRTVKIDGKITSVTRGGIFCPYTTMRIEKGFTEENKKFFDDNPDLMLCGEVVGVQNPYEEISYPEAREFGYFVFDIRDRKTSEALPIKEKMEVLEKYKLNSVRSFGLYKDGKEILKIVRGLGAESREGVVIKSPDMKTVMKYTANQSTNRDLRYAFKFYSDYGLPFMYRRLVRAAYQAYELGLSDEELEKEAAELGKSIMIPMVDTIKKVAAGGEVTEDFEITVPTEEFGRMFVDHLHHLGVVASIGEVRKSGNDVVMKISRHYQSTNDTTKSYLQGGCCHE